VFGLGTKSHALLHVRRVFVRRLLHVGAVAVVLLWLGAGVAAADPLPVADVTQSADTDDGWHLSAALTRMTINSVPNMAATAFTREGFVTGKAAATIDGNGAIPVNSGTLVMGLQLGCQVDLSEGGSVDVGGDAGISPGFNGGNLLNIVGPFAQVNGDVSINLLPGTITNLGLGKKELKGRTGEIVIHDAHVKVDGCGGQVAVRFFATAMIDTDKSDDSVNAYGDILTL
jgi:MspA